MLGYSAWNRSLLYSCQTIARIADFLVDVISFRRPSQPCNGHVRGLSLYYLFISTKSKPNRYHLLVIVLFRATRRTFEKLLIVICRGVHQHAPFFCVILVNAFHVIYLSIFLQQGIDAIALLAVIIFDICGNIYALRDLKKIQQQYEMEISQSVAPIGSTKNEHKRKMRQLLMIRAENWVLIKYVECIVPLIFFLFYYVVFLSSNR